MWEVSSRFLRAYDRMEGLVIRGDLPRSMEVNVDGRRRYLTRIDDYIFRELLIGLRRNRRN